MRQRFPVDPLANFYGCFDTPISLLSTCHMRVLEKPQKCSSIVLVYHTKPSYIFLIELKIEASDFDYLSKTSINKLRGNPCAPFR